MTELQEIFGLVGAPNARLGDDANSVTFTLQSGPVKEKGINGCQLDEVIRFARQFIDYHNKKFPCRENSIVITKLDEALLWRGERTRNREVRGVEGTKMTELQEVFGLVNAPIKDGMTMWVHGLPYCKLADDANSVTFTLQSGPVKENGINGCQIDDVIRFARQFIDYHNKKFPCRENSIVITKLDEALLWLGERTRNRELRGVEGTNQS